MIERRVKHSEDQPREESTSGFDLGPTIQFYEENIDRLTRAIPEPTGEEAMEVYVFGQEHIHLTEEQIQGLLALFPQQARDRSILQTISGKPTLWFREDTREGNIEVTDDVSEALSPTALVPSYVWYSERESGDGYNAHVELYEIPEDAASEQTRALIHAQGFVHEVAHTIMKPILDSKDNAPYVLRIRDGDEERDIDAEEHFMRFANITGKLPPVSHYASSYRDLNGNFKSDPSLTTAVNEELVETMTADLLQFANTPNPARRFMPLVDRPEANAIVEDLLYGERVNSSE